MTQTAVILGSTYNKHTGSCLQQVHWVPLTKSTLGPTYKKYTGSCLQQVHWVPLTTSTPVPFTSTLGPTYKKYTGFVPLTTSTLGATHNKYTGSHSQVHWVPLTTSTLGPNHKYTGSHSQQLHWVPITSILGPTYKKYTGSCLQQVHWVPLTTSTLGPIYNKYTGFHLQKVHWVRSTYKYTGCHSQQVHWVPFTTSTLGSTYKKYTGFVPLTSILGPAYSQHKDSMPWKKIVRCKQVLVVDQKSAGYSWVLVVTELVVSGTQCTSHLILGAGFGFSRWKHTIMGDPCHRIPFRTGTIARNKQRIKQTWITVGKVQMSLDQLIKKFQRNFAHSIVETSITSSLEDSAEVSLTSMSALPVISVLLLLSSIWMSTSDNLMSTSDNLRLPVSSCITCFFLISLWHSISYICTGFRISTTFHVHTRLTTTAIMIYFAPWCSLS